MLEFNCLDKDCGEVVRFPLKEALDSKKIACPGCGRSYSFPPKLREKIRLLDELIRALRQVRPILGQTSVVIDIEGHQVKIPYYLLVTRFTSELALDLEGEGLKLRSFISPLVGENGEDELDIGGK